MVDLLEESGAQGVGDFEDGGQDLLGEVIHQVEVRCCARSSQDELATDVCITGEGEDCVGR